MKESFLACGKSDIVYGRGGKLTTKKEIDG